MGKDSNWGYEGYLTEDQKQVLAQLRAKVKAELPPKEYLQKDSSLLRYLRARGFNLNKTWTMLTEDVEWRDPFEGYVFQRERDFGGAYALHEQGAIRLAGKSKLGHPVLSVLARAYNPRLVEDTIQIVYFFVFYIDEICRRTEQAGQETFFGIFDLEGFSLANFSFPQISLAISILQNHYPERLGGVFVINAPWAFTAVWRMIRPLLDERTRNKVNILGSNYLEALQEYVDLDQIEVEYGGKHPKFAIPDEIVQMALDNERKAKEEELAKAAAITATTTIGAAPAPSISILASSDTTPSSPNITASFKAVKTKQSKVKQLVRKMMFLSDKRSREQPGEEGESSYSTLLLPQIPSSPDELTAAATAGELEKLSNALIESRVEQDRLAEQVKTWKLVHENEMTNKQSQLRFLQVQIILITLIALGGSLLPYVLPQ
ncbi:hypothetical protein BASA81_002604 [Batrachochytrium salamandrivorans]|nr:hypothetical protein BASA81_002604 [Batrachochytrium salamandrivorans]